jgi:nitric oxide reductase activation protein
MHGDAQASLGLYITELLGKLPADSIEKLRRMLDAGDSANVRAWLASQRGNEFHFYDEWDYRIGDYRQRWCRLAEYEVAGDGGRYVNRVLARAGDLINRIRREFLLMRPEQFRKVRGMEDGEDFDLNALVDAHADRRTRRTPSDRVYVARRREERDVATLFLIDMSASTDEPVGGAEHGDPSRRVIDVTKETLVVMSAVLNEIGDAYSVSGFSGHGREQVEYYQIKTFSERWGPTVRARIGGIEPKRSTRMGAALRHAGRKLDAVAARARHLLLLSDGFPQDYDYGEDRRSNVYGIRDTTVALQELEARGIKTFCITVDPAGHDYLGEMCPASRYAVIEDVEALPEELPRIYRTVTR